MLRRAFVPLACGLALALTACSTGDGPVPEMPASRPSPTPTKQAPTPSSPTTSVRATPSPTTPATETSRPKPATPPSPTATAADPKQWACTKDADCTQTCALGAVSSTWLADHRDADNCDDGCGWLSGSIACRDGECVTLTDDGNIDERCTKRTAPRFP